MFTFSIFSKLGVAYDIDKTLGNCSVIPIPKTTLDVKSHSPKYLEMRSPMQWIYADNTSVSYEGQVSPFV